LFFSSMFYPLEPLPAAFRAVALANPITWQVDVLRYATIGYGASMPIALEAVGFVVFSVISLVLASRALQQHE